MKSFKANQIQKDVNTSKRRNRRSLTHTLACKAFEVTENFAQRNREKDHTARRIERRTLHQRKRQPDVYAKAG